MGRLYIEGAGFSLESATERTPDAAKYYIFLNERVDCSYETREEALEEYHRRCRDYWNAKLESARNSERLMGARGLLSLDKSDLNAWNELARNGSQSEKAKAAFWIRKLGGEPEVSNGLS
ncbi:MAG TPA: hypothetical protein VFJ58_22810 [Armatimonadota bacterium]|nr:hypothetical protein [Armatimonadota bacterium]